MKPMQFRTPAARRDRTGATLVLVTVMSVTMLAVTALVLNWSYIELTRTQLRSSVDAASKAALITLSETQSQSQARTAAQRTATLNTVAGAPLLLRTSEILIGNSSKQPDGSFLFQNGVQPLNAVRINAQRTSGSRSGTVPVLFANFINPDAFQANQESTATRIDHDVVLVIDRSASMAWDLSGVDFQYPAERLHDSPLQNYFRPPHATGSRWAALVDALEEFKSVIDERDLNAQVALVSYASTYTFGAYNSQQVSTDQVLSRNTSDFLNAANAIGTQAIIGDTNIAAGMNRGKSVILDSGRRRNTANRTMIVLTDGVRTEGSDPATAATSIATSRIAIHTITFSDGADIAAMQSVAANGGGRHYHAISASQLNDAFRAIAEELPAVLIQ